MSMTWVEPLLNCLKISAESFPVDGTVTVGKPHSVRFCCFYPTLGVFLLYLSLSCSAMLLHPLCSTLFYSNDLSSLYSAAKSFLCPGAKRTEQDEVKWMRARLGYLEGNNKKIIRLFQALVTLINIANWHLIMCVYIQSKPIIVLWKTPKISFITVDGATCPIPHWLLMREI